MMNNAQLAVASFNDIVFDGRNKGYGAYELRHLYQRHVSRALVIATTIFALLVAVPAVAAYFKEKMPIAKVRPIPAQPMTPPPLDADPVTPPPPPPVAATPPPPPPVAPQLRFTPYVPAPDEQVTEDVSTNEDLDKGKVGSTTIEGPEVPIDLNVLPPVDEPTVIGDVVDKSIYVSVEQMPELPGGGGVAAIVAAIQKAARYPSRAMGAGVEGRVYVSFVVNAQGDVVDVKIVKGLGSGLDEETVRAIKTLPRFIPGKQNGREVSVSYSVPVTFKIQ